MTTQTGRFSQPRLAPLSGIERVEPQDPGTRLKPVARRVAVRELRQLGIELDKIDRGKRVALSEREANRADPRADVDDPALPSVARRRNEQGGVRPDPMAALRLHEQEPAAQPSVLGQRVRGRGALELRRRLSHRAVLFPDPLRQ